MPQMSPMKWMLLYNTFMINLILICVILNFLSINKNLHKFNLTSKKNQFKFKW